MIPEIFRDKDRQICAIVIRTDFEEQSGIRFFTPPEFSQQLAYMKREKGEIIEPHIHNEVNREVVRTQEVLIIRSGKVQVDLYTNEHEYWDSFTSVSYTHLRAHETGRNLVCRLLLEKKKKKR